MLVIYRTNEGFVGDIVTVQTGDAALTAALLGPDLAVLDVTLPVADAAVLIQNISSYAILDEGSGPLLCEREGEGEPLAEKRVEAEEASVKVVISEQLAAVVAKPVDVKPREEAPVEELIP
jgi:CheY-like chemotaxis protein